MRCPLGRRSHMTAAAANTAATAPSPIQGLGPATGSTAARGSGRRRHDQTGMVDDPPERLHARGRRDVDRQGDPCEGQRHRYDERVDCPAHASSPQAHDAHVEQPGEAARDGERLVAEDARHVQRERGRMQRERPAPRAPERAECEDEPDQRSGDRKAREREDAPQPEAVAEGEAEREGGDRRGIARAHGEAPQQDV